MFNVLQTKRMRQKKSSTIFQLLNVLPAPFVFVHQNFEIIIVGALINWLTITLNIFQVNFNLWLQENKFPISFVEYSLD